MNGLGRTSGRSTKGFNTASGRTKLAVATAVAGALASASAASAQLIAQDHFLIGTDPSVGQYTSAAAVNGQNPTISGFSGAWTSNGVSNSSQWIGQNTALTTSSVTYPAGGRLRFTTPGADNLNTRVSRSLSTYTAANTHYLSLLSNITTGDTHLDGFIGGGFTNAVSDTDLSGATGGLRGILIGGKGNAATGKTDLVLRHHGVTGLQDDVIVAGIPNTTTRFDIVKLEVNAEPGNPLGDDRITIYHSPTNAYTEALAALTVQGAGVLTFHSATMDTNADIAQLTFTSLDYSTTSHFDESRLAEDWGSLSGYTQTQWSHNGNESWDTAGNWSNGLPSGVAAQFLGGISADTAVNIGSMPIVGALVFDNAAHSYTVGGAGIEINVPSGANGAILVSSGSHTISAPLTLDRNAIISVTNANSTLDITGALTFASNALALTKSGAGTAVVPYLRSANSLSVAVNDAGTLRVAPNGTSAATSKLNALTLGATSKLDLTNNKLIVVGGTLGAASSGVYSGLTGLIQQARNGGAWDGPGILTSFTAAQGGAPLTTLAIAKADDVGRVGQTFGGITLATGDVLMGYTYAGDMNLDGFINGDDYARIDTGYVAVSSGYENGDLNYDGRIDADDYFIIDKNYGSQGAAFAAAALPGGVSAVPEPASIALLGLGAMLMGRRSRR